MYFKNRAVAGKMLAAQIAPKYAGKKCSVVALSNGATIVGAEVALSLKCALTMLLTEPITLPRENDTLASVSQNGNITYNQLYSTGELEELTAEFRSYIEEQRIKTIHDINSLLGNGGLIRKDLLSGHAVILVSDGLNSGFSLDAAADFIKPIKIDKLVVATPLASVPAVDRMHVLADDIYCLDVVTDYINTDHYYESHDSPSQEDAIKIIKSIVEHWHEDSNTAKTTL